MLSDALHVPEAAHWPASWERFAESIDAKWVTRALEATGKASVRRRRLPAEQVVWLVIGMALMRDRSMAEVVDRLGLALSTHDGQPVVAPSAVSQGRERLGEEPMRWLFDKLGATWGHESASRDRWRELALYGVDGTKFNAADSQSNEEAFGRHGGGNGPSAYPLVRVVALMALRSRMIVSAVIGSYAKESEVALAKSLWPLVPDRSLVLVDRGFLAAPILQSIAREGVERHWMTRANKNSRYEVIRPLGEGDALVELTVEDETLRAYPDLSRKWQVRAVRYQRTGHEPQTLFTSLLDADAYPASELAALYHERWEVEMAFDDLKTTQLRAEPVLRSQRAEGVRQELWGILLAYNLVRREIERVAKRAGVPSRQVSFIAALHLICDEWTWATLASAKAGALPKALVRLEEKIKRFILPERRTGRAYPRVVKQTTSRYESKAAHFRRAAAKPTN